MRKQPDQEYRDAVNSPEVAQPKLYGLCLVKNEDDIIAQTLTYALSYCDKIIVIDNGSTDETWNVINALSAQHPRIVPFLQTREAFSNGLRALAYNRYHAEFSEGDWWLIVDGDEFLAEDPRPVIQQAMREKADIIKSWQIQFLFTDIDYKNWLSGKDSRDLPIYERRRHYIINWQENRLFRNDPAKPWNPQLNNWYPDGYRKVARRRILNRHYQFRDPEQMQKRLSLRLGHSLFPHVPSADWRSAIVSSKKLSCYDGGKWRFTASGLIYYYKKVLAGTCKAVLQRLRSLHSPSAQTSFK